MSCLTTALMSLWADSLLLGICWGSVPVNPQLVTRRQRALIALAGPAANLGLFLVSLILCIVCIKLGLEFGTTFFLYGGILNLALCFLNLMPVPGFDGGAVLLAFLPVERLRDNELVKGIMIGAVLLLFTCIDKLFAAAAQVMNFCLEGIVSCLA